MGQHTQTAKHLKIAVLGCGTVGTQVVRLLQEDSADFQARTGAVPDIIGIAVKNLSVSRPNFIPKEILTDNPEKLIAEADLVIELIGGIEPAKSWIKQALSAGKPVVTGNKALLATHGKELFELARTQGVSLYYEAAVAGAIPVVRAVYDSLAGDQIHSVQGIMNGTTNYILDQMKQQGWSFAYALEQAQAQGYAEADPTADVDGFDAAAKCALLAKLAFHVEVGLEDVAVTGIRQITDEDIATATKLGRTIKLLALAEKMPDTDKQSAISLRVEPVLISNDNPLSQVGGAFNAVLIEAESAGKLVFSGAGAGGKETASAVLGDVMLVMKQLLNQGMSVPVQPYRELPLLTSEESRRSYCIRLEFSELAEKEIRQIVETILSENQVELTYSDFWLETSSKHDIMLVSTNRITAQTLTGLLKDLKRSEKIYKVSNPLILEG